MENQKNIQSFEIDVDLKIVPESVEAIWQGT